MNTRPKPHAPPVPPRTYRVMHAMMWPMTKMLGLPCRRYAELCAAKLDRPLTRVEAIQFRIHGLICGLCRRLPKQLEHLRALTRCYCDEPDSAATVTLLDEPARERIRQALMQETNEKPE